MPDYEADIWINMGIFRSHSFPNEFLVNADVNNNNLFIF